MSNILPLGDRFRLACSLAQSLYAMHAVGWVHKKQEPISSSCEGANSVLYGLRLFCFYLLNPRLEGSLPPVVRWIPPILTCADLVTRDQNVSFKETPAGYL